LKKSVKKIIIAISVLALGAAIFFGIAQVSARPVRESNGKTVATDVKTADKTRDDFKNILVLGTDRQAGLCDVMMLVNVNFTKNRATVAHIPRDTYAKYTDGSYKKLNGAYNTLGGARQAADFLSDAMGLEIHHYVCVGLDTVAEVVDAVGGVDVRLPCDMSYRDPEQGLYIDLKKGVRHLDGALAEKFVRFRSSYVQGDLGRIDAQKLFLAAFFEKISSELSPALILKLTEAARGVETDLAVSDLLSMGVRCLGMDGGDVGFVTLPGREAVATESGAWYYVLSRASAEELMTSYFNAEDSFDKKGVFFNGQYKSFADIYDGYEQYSVTELDDIAKNGIDIQIKT
jgi:LCP family protein required for cell wall assembly